MDIHFVTREIEKLCTEDNVAAEYPTEVVMLVRRRIRYIEAATDVRDLALLTSLGYERSEGHDGTSSVTISRGWRLLLSEEHTATGTVLHIHKIFKDFGGAE